MSDPTGAKKVGLDISNDGTFLFSTQVGSGIALINVEDIQNMFILDIIKLTGTIQSVYLAPLLNDKIYMATLDTIYIHERNIPDSL